MDDRINILCLEDDSTCVYILQELISDAKTENKEVQVISTDSPEEALELLSKNESGFFNIILVDLVLKSKAGRTRSGLDFIEEFERNSYDLKCDSLYVFSVDINPQSRERALEFKSVKDYLIKPIDELQLRRIIPEAVS